jgi:hypothetical protein
MTRSQKKRAKTQRIAMSKGQAKTAKKIKDTAKAWAVILTADRRGSELWGRLCLCSECQQNYCLAYGGGRIWCRTCRFFPCLKITEPLDPIIHQECKECLWKKEDYANSLCM